MLKHAEDWRSITFVFVAIFLTIAGFFVHLSGASYLAWFTAQFVFSYCSCVINHNHTHSPTFNHRTLNHGFGYLLTIAKGHTSSQVIVPHNLNHHVYPGQKEDWSRPELARGSIGLIRLPTYLWRATREMSRQRKLAGAPRLPASIGRQAKRERWILVLFTLSCLSLGFAHFLTFVLPIWILVMLTLLSANLIQHDGCDAYSEWEHSRNFTGGLGNWMMFNNGYHTIHHLKPALHWSLLAREHTHLIEPHLRGKCEEKSIPKFVFGQYLFSGTAKPAQSQIQAPSSPLEKAPEDGRPQKP